MPGQEQLFSKADIGKAGASLWALIQMTVELARINPKGALNVWKIISICNRSNAVNLLIGICDAVLGMLVTKKLPIDAVPESNVQSFKLSVVMPLETWAHHYPIETIMAGCLS